VVRDLLGKILVKNNLKGKIVETEAYFTNNDKASHRIDNESAAGRSLLFVNFKE